MMVVIEGFYGYAWPNRLMLSFAVAMVYAVMTMANLHVLERGLWREFIIANLCMIVISGAFFLRILWTKDGVVPNPLGLQLGVTMCFVAVANTVLVQMRALETQNGFLRAARYAAAAMLYAEFAAVAMLVWEVGHVVNAAGTGFSSLFLGFAIPGGGMSLLSILIVPLIIRRVERRSLSHAESVSARTPIEMTCPSCGERGTFVNGPARCPACRFRMLIEIEEPRCLCGYLLYRLTGERCPECGRTVSARATL